MTGNVLIDSSIGKETVFTFTWSYSTVPLNISLYDPDNVLYCNRVDDPSCQPVLVLTDTTFHTITFEIPGIAKVCIFVLYAYHDKNVMLVASFSSPKVDLSILCIHKPLKIQQVLKKKRSWSFSFN